MVSPTLADILPIVRKAGKALVERRGADRIQTKAAQDFVTEVEFAVQ